MEVIAPWICDACGKDIASVGDGWVEWLNRLDPVTRRVEGSYSNLRLVHHRRASPRASTKNACYHDEDAYFAKYEATVADLPLDSFIGPDGLVLLLEFLSDKRFVEPEEVLELIKRLHVPGYEQARPSFEAALADGARVECQAKVSEARSVELHLGLAQGSRD